MKLLLENWREYLEEDQEEVEEGLASKLALGAALAGAASPAMAQGTGTADAGEKTQQVDTAKAAAELVNNEDGTFSLTLDIPGHFQDLMISMKRPIVTNWARAEFAKKMAGVEDSGTVNLNISGRVSSMTANTVTFTGNVIN
jgi:hypothetical protein